MTVFVDTNILLDVLARREPFFPASRRIWELSELSRIDGLVSAISFNNTFYIIRKAADAETARESLRKIRSIFKPVGLDEKILNQALDSPLGDFEDAIQFFSALYAGASFLITRNPDDFPKDSPVAIVTAETFLALNSFPAA